MEMMDLEFASIVLGVVAVTAVAVYLVSVMGIREKSFEEAIAEQKKRSEDLLGKKEKKKPVIKEKTKKQKRPKPIQNIPVETEIEETQVNASQPSPPVAHPHLHRVEIDPDPEILEDPPHPDSRRSSVVKHRESVVKSILTNKEEHSPVLTDSDVEPANHFDRSHPKDDLELKKQQSREHSPPSSPAIKNSRTNDIETVDAPAPPVHVTGNGIDADLVNELDEAVRSYTPESSSNDKHKGKKSKRGGGGGGDSDINPGKLESALEKVSLSSSEIQSLIDILLNKQHAGDSEWINKGKSDTVGTLKKQLVDKEQQLLEEQATIQTLQHKLRDMRQEFSNERNKFSTMRRVLEDANNQKNHEIQQFTVRLTQQRDTAAAEKISFAQQIQKLQTSLKTAREEAQAMSNALALEQQNRAKIESLEREVEALRPQCVHLEAQLHAALQSNQEVNTQARSMGEHLRALEERKELDEHAIHSQYTSKIAEMDSHLRQQMSNLESNLRAKSDTEKQLEESKKKLEESQKAEASIKKSLDTSKAHVTELETKIKDLENSLTTLKKEKESLVEKLTIAESAEDQSPAIQELQSKVEEAQAVAQKLVSENKDLRAEIEKSGSDLQSQKGKNDELREKNSKLMDTMKTTERNLENQIKQTERLVQEVRTKTQKEFEDSVQKKIRSYFPQLVQKDKSDWLEAFVQAVREQIDQNGDSKELNSKIEKLEQEVQHYQSVLSNTEGLLSTLQGSIEKEERKWTQLLQEKDEQLEAFGASHLSSVGNSVS